MGRAFVFILILGVSFSSWAHSGRGAEQGPVIPLGDDFFPWPRGSECLFPWDDIEGAYFVSSRAVSYYSGSFVEFLVDERGQADNRLEIRHYDRKGWLYAKGQGRIQKDNRLVHGVLWPLNTSDRPYAVVVRSFPSLHTLQCQASRRRVIAISFCQPGLLAGCQNADNYMLEKLN